MSDALRIALLVEGTLICVGWVGGCLIPFEKGVHCLTLVAGGDHVQDFLFCACVFAI